MVWGTKIKPPNLNVRLTPNQFLSDDFTCAYPASELAKVASGGEIEETFYGCAVGAGEVSLKHGTNPLDTITIQVNAVPTVTPRPTATPTGTPTPTADRRAR